MATPTYQGAGQPTANEGSGWFGRVGSFFGGATPAYQPAPVPRAPDPIEPAESAKDGGACTGADAFGLGPFAIIVPRPACMTEPSQP